MPSRSPARPRLAFVSRELWPFDVGGGIGRCVWTAARHLRHVADVTLITTDRHRGAHEAMTRGGDPRLPAGVRIAFAEEPGPDHRPFFPYAHAWSASALRALRGLYAPGELDLVEFSDYQAEAFATIQARRANDPAIASALVVVRIQTTLEIARVLDGNAGLDAGYRATIGMERACLRLADRVVWPGGDVLGAYRRYYGADAIGRPQRVAQAFRVRDADGGGGEAPRADGPLRLLYFGRLERRKGVEQLVRAARALGAGGWELTVLGGDTATGPLQSSMRAHLLRLADGDERIRFHEQVAHEDLGAFIQAHHVVVSPSVWECWSNVVREALTFNRPVLATPVGGVVDVIEPGQSGWSTPDATVEGLRAGLAGLLERRGEIDRLIAEGRPARFLRAQVESEDPLGAYRELASSRPGPPRAPAAAPGVTALVTVCEGDGDVSRTLRSLARQTVAPRDVVAISQGGTALLAPGCLSEVDVFDALAEREGGHGAAVAMGLRAGAGELVLLISAGTTIAPGFIERCLSALAAAPSAGAVTAWGTGWSAAAAPLGAAAAWSPDAAVAATALLARRADLRDCFPVAAREAQAALHGLALAMDRAGRPVVVVPEHLVGDLTFRAPEHDAVQAETMARAADERTSWLSPGAAAALGETPERTGDPPAL